MIECKRLPLAGICLTLLLAPSVGSAQRRLACDDSGDSFEEARRLFLRGIEATNEERWSDAVPSLRRAYELSCRPSALNNLGTVLRALGRHREARDVYEQLLENPGNLEPRLIPIARQSLEEERARIAVLELLEVAPELRPQINLDGRVITDDGSRPIRLEADGGAHSLQVRIDDHQPFLWSGELSEGQVERLLVSFEPNAAASGGGNEGWIVLGVIAGVALAVGGVVLAVVLQDEAQLRPYSPTRVVNAARGGGG